MPRPTVSHQGFSLLEVAIVIAVIGLIAGGVVVGQSMIDRTRVVALMNDLGKYKNAYVKFKKQYEALPGDMLDATEFWGTDPDGCPTHTNRVPKKETCNGGGDGYIGYGAGAATTAQFPEMFRAWQHLADAGYIEGTYTGVTGAGAAYHAVPGENAPSGPLPNSGFGMQSLGTYGDTRWTTAVYGTVMAFGGATTATFPYASVLTPREVYNVDSKMDDGRPNSGAIMTFKSTADYHTGCADATEAAYSLTSRAKLCGLLYIIDPFS